jgi:hypothetical protein
VAGQASSLGGSGQHGVDVNVTAKYVVTERGADYDGQDKVCLVNVSTQLLQQEDVRHTLYVMNTSMRKKDKNTVAP